MRIRIAARGSKLSRIQVMMVENYLHKLGIETEFIEIKTKADLFQNEPLSKLGKGVFEKEVNQAVLDNKADVAVHSMKDILTEISENLEIYAVLPRDPPFDILISRKNLFNLEPNSIIGTSSIRRKNFLTFYRNDLNIKDLRGNIDTRLKKYFEGQYDGIIIAEASIYRLKEQVQYYRLDPHLFTPEANQGIIVVIGRKKDETIKKIFNEINDKDTLEIAIAERKALSIVGGGCHSPIGVYFEKYDKDFHGIISSSFGRKKITIEEYFHNMTPYEAGELLGKRFLEEIKNEGIIP
ncbi:MULTISPECIES: hydroxymethylbilane synthase [Sulfurisphaera]|uniref:Probable porphobilinogen deaminase n=3 Tax=Sulfurisphaera TaxID=69655 RepID=HEM3_SULTO|nr:MULTISPECIES: hydroxymethylbilane synthase [Sulfurisphaera]Q976H1.1 RecName: Full=Probable porphobilinogen deaminase; Short=PBG; AltName: Full=Hydroxymethylbilane synthase; Short=HMBS; AltName: Full=Pre-uroporphyrinogen synthase [Sulfurisphaera tokodaii str. 7]MBB5253240.1 hydroxymethylbilane synthase [Sulfurisphaera ohwakuensis]QGR15853.1 hydroxymethylbilane synthase [Sulfurisphaera ohwakuensis]BAK54199.1 hydroxymethylbilane synthase [Sulfurisphaera tokodaii str. 7]HII74338.1 hydroxymethyl